ncbi:MAG: hypothetical protein Q9161_003254 [Pseudevernia consocians]
MSRPNPPPRSTLKDFVIVEADDDEDDPFELYDHVIIKLELRDYDSSNRSGDTPVYRIVDQDGDDYYEIQVVRTGERGLWYFQIELELLEAA